MKNQFKLKGCFIIALILALILSTAPMAFAETTIGKWEIKSPMFTPKVSFQTEVVNGKVYVIGGKDNSNKILDTVEEYDPVADKWTQKSPMHTAREYFQTEVINGKIYVIGGIISDSQIPATLTSSVEMYDPITDKWTTKSSMKESRVSFRTETVNGKIYAIGGNCKFSTLTPSIEEYNPDTDNWTQKKSMKVARSNFQSKVIDGEIYVLGGWSMNDEITSVEKYDPVTDTWSDKAPMINGRHDFQAEIIQGKIYVTGGYTYNAIEEYDPDSDEWHCKKSLNINQYEFKTALLGCSIFVIGGNDHTNKLNTVEEYSPTYNQWTNKESMNVPRTLFQTQVVNGKIYVIGGCSSNGYINSVEEYTPAQTDPTLTVTASPNKVKVGSTFTTDVAIHNANNIYAEDIKINYDSSLFEYTGVQAKDGIKIYKEDKSAPGTVRFILASLGKDNAANGDKGLITLQFKAKSPGTGKVDIVKGRIADNSTLEMDVSEANCGEDTITVEGVKDVNRSGAFTLLDLGIDAGYYGMDASQTDSTRFDADVVPDGKIDDKDLTSITESILANMDYQPNIG